MSCQIKWIFDTILNHMEDLLFYLIQGKNTIHFLIFVIGNLRISARNPIISISMNRAVYQSQSF